MAVHLAQANKNDVLFWDFLRTPQNWRPGRLVQFPMHGICADENVAVNSFSLHKY